MMSAIHGTLQFISPSFGDLINLNYFLFCCPIIVWGTSSFRISNALFSLSLLFSAIIYRLKFAVPDHSHRSSCNQESIPAAADRLRARDMAYGRSGS